VGPVNLAVVVTEAGMGGPPPVPPEMRGKEQEHWNEVFKAKSLNQDKGGKMPTAEDMKKEAARRASVKGLPKKYGDHKNSDLTVTVETAGTTYNIELKSSAK
jgi:hypothetical protein